MGKKGVLSKLGLLALPFRAKLEPSLVIVGAQKAGTSALYNMLIRHTAVIPPQRKELDFFGNDDHYTMGIRHYRSMWPARPLRSGTWVTLDATPGYLPHPEAAVRIKTLLPNALIVVLLRDPVQRAFSDWNMFHQFKDHGTFSHLYDARTFEQAIDEELITDNPATHYVDRGYYAPQLERYFNVFGRERVLVFAYPEFKKDPVSVVNTILRAMGLREMTGQQPLSTVRANVRAYEAPMDGSVRERLRSHFAPHMSALAELLGRRLDLDEAKH